MSAMSHSPQSVREILEEGQPWFRVTKLGGDLATVLFQSAEKDEADTLADAVRERGFRAEVHRTIALSSHVPEMVSLAIDTANKWMVGEILKGIIPPALNWLVDRLRHLPTGAARPHPALLFQDRICPWLDERFGRGGWRYDPEGLECCTLGGHVVLALVEENTNTEIVLHVHGLTGLIEEVQFSRRAERERKSK